MIEFFVAGRPGPKGSRTQAVTRAGAHYTRPASKFEKPWVDAVAWTCLSLVPIPPPYRVALSFRFQRPAKPKYVYPVTVDIDKAIRATLDGMVKGRLLCDDKHVIEVSASTSFGDQGCLIAVEQADGAPPRIRRVDLDGTERQAA